MADLRIKLPDGQEITFMQAARIGARSAEMGWDNVHWHLNDCGCCVTLHGPDCAYVINSDGEETFFPERGCSCER